MHAPQPRPDVATLTGYTWEESSESLATRLGLAVSDIVRFDTNTVPWQLPVDVPLDSLAWNEYPDSTYSELVRAIGTYTAQPPAAIVVGAGADELISLVTQAYLDATRSFALADLTYPMFTIASRIAGGIPRMVACDQGFAIDRDGLLAAAARAHVTWIANPDNPTGGLLPQQFLRDVASASTGIVVVDEAYAEFTEASALEWIDDAANLVVIRTLSKAFGLAGMRIGYLVAAPDVVATLNKLRPPASISVVSARVGAAALQRAAEVRDRVRALVAVRHNLAGAVAETGRPVIEGAANFILVRLEPGAAKRALAAGLVLRSFGPGHRLREWSRITVRSAEENARLLAVL